MDKVWAAIVVFIVAVWCVTGLYEDYATMRADITRYEKNSEDFQTSIKALSDVGIATARANKEALDLAIERLAAGGGR